MRSVHLKSRRPRIDLRKIIGPIDGAATKAARKESADAHASLLIRPVAWRVKDFADGWIIFQNEADAYHEAERTGAMMQGLYVRDGK